MIKLSVVIGTYNQKEKLEKALQSLLKQTMSPALYEIIVVDSMSADGTDTTLNVLCSTFSNLKYIRQENLGRPGARNRGITEAKGEIILLTDADMLADINLLYEHLKAHENHPAAAFEGSTYNYLENGKAAPYIKEKLRPGQKLKFSYFLTGNLSIRKQTLLDIGGFDQDFAGYGWEDIELGYRLSKAGVPLYYLPSAVNFHDHQVEAEDMLKRKYHMGRSALIFYQKHPNREIKYYLGMNPLAMGIFESLKKRPKILNFIVNKAKISGFYRYILEEYYYRLGLAGEAMPVLE
ncbi:glycosyltransferase family 2 protein [Candidatus Saganbacteria bacterium]|nr:glycosyltransferase family 2 protein [Candidatus Saganbacteria bacterium]